MKKINKLNDTQIFEILFKILTVILLFTLVIMSFKLTDVYDRLNSLEEDYKIYEVNLQELKENQNVQFGRK